MASRYTWECPIPSCGNTIGVEIKLSYPPTCRGRYRTHRTTNMQLQGEMTMADATTKTKTTKKAKVPDKECQCNAVPVDGKPHTFEACDALTRGTFAPGHDAKLKSALISCAVADAKYGVIVGGKVTNHDPAKVAAERGWSKFIDRAIERRDEKAAKAAAKAAEKEAAKAAKAADKPAKKAPAKKSTRARKSTAK